MFYGSGGRSSALAGGDGLRRGSCGDLRGRFYLLAPVSVNSGKETADVADHVDEEQVGEKQTSPGR